MAFIIARMKFAQYITALWLILLAGCQAFSPATVTVQDGEKIVRLTTNENTPLSILSEAGITAQPQDRVLANGIPYALDETIPSEGHLHLQLIRAVNITLNTPQGNENIQTSALTVGDVLMEYGITIGVKDEVNPPLTSTVTDSMTITFIPARELTVTSGGTTMQIRSAAETVGAALAEAGMPLTGLDTSLPAENDPLPADGRIQVVRVTESLLVELQAIPFRTENVQSEEVAFGQQEILQSGSNGIAMVRTRVRFEDGVEVSRVEEDETILKEPVTQVVANGSKIVLSPVGGDAPYQYWYATEMYASWYSPCNSGVSGCSYGTASGARAGYGIVAVDYSYYSYLGGMRVYIPGYGVATIGDTGGGPIIESVFGVPRYQWIDLGYDDNNIGGLSGWVTVYFLEPAPAEIPYFFQTASP